MSDQSFSENIARRGRGRPRKSSTHKKKHRREYLNNLKQQKIANGTYIPPGRPKKKVII